MFAQERKTYNGIISEIDDNNRQMRIGNDTVCFLGVPSSSWKLLCCGLRTEVQIEVLEIDGVVNEIECMKVKSIAQDIGMVIANLLSRCHSGGH